MTDCNSTTFPAKIQDVRSAAASRLAERKNKLAENLRALAEADIKRIEEENKNKNSLFCRLGISKRSEVPTVDALLAKWQKEFDDGTLVHMSRPYWEYFVIDTDWWRRNQTLCYIHGEDDTIINLSIEDAQLIQYARYMRDQVKNK